MARQLHRFKASLKASIVLASILVLLAGAACTLQEQESLSSETYELGSFNRISFSGIGNVSITQGETNAVSIVAPSRLQDALRFQVVDGLLQVSLDEKLIIANLNPEQSIQVLVAGRDIRDIQFVGSGTLRVAGLHGEVLRLTQLSVSRVELADIEVGLLEINASGGGSILAQGVVREQNLVISGAVQYDGRALQVNSVNAILRGNAQAIVNATGALVVDAGVGTALQYLVAPASLVIIQGADQVSPAE